MLRSLIIILLISFTLTSCLTVNRISEAISEPSTGGFVPNLPDVPMPKNFLVDGETASFFDSAEGRIAEINAQGFGEVEDVEDFFDDNLPEFGWENVGDDVYKKEGEILLITIEKTGQLTTIKFKLRPV